MPQLPPICKTYLRAYAYWLDFIPLHSYTIPMLKQVSVRSFTRFGDKTRPFGFAGGINVFVGENGTGKSHILKLLYANLKALQHTREAPELPTKTYLEITIAQRLKGIFMPDSLGRLAQRQRGNMRAQIAMEADGISLAYSFSSQSSANVALDTAPAGWWKNTCIFIPTRELLSIFPGFLARYAERQTPYEETWRDLAILLGDAALRGPHSDFVRAVLPALEDALGGRVVLEDGRFYISQNNKGYIEAHLLAEGLRKIGMVAQLVANGSLKPGSVLFWDEPEASLNPSLISKLAAVIVALAKQEVQVFLATHSLFLMREISLLTEPQGTSRGDVKYFSFSNVSGTPSVEVEQGSSLSSMRSIVSFTRQMEQDVRLIDFLSHEQ